MTWGVEAEGDDEGEEDSDEGDDGIGLDATKDDFDNLPGAKAMAMQLTRSTGCIPKHPRRTLLHLPFLHTSLPLVRKSSSFSYQHVSNLCSYNV